MKQLCVLTVLSLLLTIAGCSPLIQTQIFTTRPVSAAADEVKVCQAGQAPADSAVMLGQVAVKDTGFSTGCSYMKVVSIAQKTTAKYGGNLLVINKHTDPDIVAICHQIWGDMYYVPDSVLRTHSFPATYYTSDNNSPLFKKYKQYSIRNTLYANVGYGFILSDFQLPEGATGNPRNGVEYSLGYQWTGASYIGAGIKYSYYSSSFHYGEWIKTRMHYIAPEFVTRAYVGKRALLTGSAGVGYVLCSEFPVSTKKSVSTSGVGFHLGGGFEYRVEKHVGLGVDIYYYQYQMGSIGDAAAGISGGISRLSLTGGLRFYL